MMSNDTNPISKEIPLEPNPVVSTETYLTETKEGARSTPSISFPFSENPSLPSKTESFPVKATFITDSFLHELENVISNQSQIIEKQLKEIKENTQAMNVNTVIDNLLMGEEWASDMLNSAHTTVQEGLDYLDRIFPPLIFKEIFSSKQPHLFKEISNIGATLLGSISNGSKQVALICKIQLLDRSKALLQEIKMDFESQLAVYQSGKLNRNQKNKMGVKLKKMSHAIDKWKTQIIVEENKLKKEQSSSPHPIKNFLAPPLGFSQSYQPFNFSPGQFILKHLSFISDFSWLTKGVTLAAGAFALYQVRQENTLFSDWKKFYKKWKKEQDFQIKIKSDATETPIKIQSAEEHKNNLLETVKTKKFITSRNKLKNCGIELPTAINSKQTLIGYLETHSNIINQYVEYRQKLETLNLAISTSAQLLEKRLLIVKKKSFLLSPRFHIVEPQIKNKKKDAYTQDLQFIFTQVQNPDCNIKEVEKRFNKWEIFKNPISAQNQPLFLAFEKFKNQSNVYSQQHLLRELTKWSELQNPYFDNWFLEQNKENLMREYIDHQETIEIAVKNSVKLMVEQKLQLESRFQSLKSTDNHTQFTMTTILFTSSVTLAILGTVSVPLGGLGLIFLGLSVVSTVLSVSFLTASYIYALYYKPHTSETLTIAFQVKMSIASIRSAIAVYFHKSKEKKLSEIAKILHKLHTSSPELSDTERSNNPQYQAALVNYQKAKLNFEKSEEKVKYWNQTLKKFELTIAEAQSKDFCKFAYQDNNKTMSSFDMLDTLQEAIKNCDFRFLSPETRFLFETQLGINLENLQSEMRKNPDAVKNSIKSFLALTNTEFFDFIRNQQDRITKGTGSPFA